MALSDVEHDDLLGVHEESTKTTNDDIASLLKTLTASVEKLAASATASGNQPPPKRRRVADDDSDAEMDETVNSSKHKTFEICEETKTFLQTAFGLPRLANNKTRNSWIAQYGLPEGDETRCSKLDSIIKNELPKEALDADRKLSRLQNFVLDVAGPLTAAYEELVTEDHPDVDRVQQAVQLALRILAWGIPQPSFHKRGERKLSAA